LTTVKLSEGVAKINNTAFAGCTGLTTVIIENKSTIFGSNVFQNCSAIATFKGSTTALEQISSQVLQSIELTSGTTIKQGQFNNCEKLQTIILPDTITTIGASAFANSGITTIDLSHVTSIGESAFDSCLSLTTVILNDNSDASGTKLTTIAQKVFNACEKLKSITLPEGITTIDESAFNNCGVLNITSWPSSLQTVGNLAFANCRSLQSFEGTNALTSVGENAFLYCESLKTLTMPNASISIADYTQFSTCTKLETLVAHMEVFYAIYSSATNNFSSLVTATITKGELVAGGSESVTADIFSGCTKLTNVTLADTISVIGSGAFKNCTSLSSISFSKNMETIGVNAFSGCTGLATIYYGGTSEEWQTFTSGTGIRSGNDVLTSDSVTKIFSTSDNTVVDYKYDVKNENGLAA
jgi:hypothetical protein